MSDPTLTSLARRLGNPLTRGGSTITDTELLELLAHGEQLADLTERCTRVARTLAHDVQDERNTPDTRTSCLPRHDSAHGWRTGAVPRARQHAQGASFGSLRGRVRAWVF
jgi:hypothetical protein